MASIVVPPLSAGEAGDAAAAAGSIAPPQRAPSRVAAPEAIDTPALPGPDSGTRHGLEVALRAGGATLIAGAAAFLISPPIAPVVAIAAGVAVTAFELSRVRATVMRRLDELAADVAQAQPLAELRSLLPLRRPLPPMQGFAIAPDCALLLARMVADERPEVILETGSGVSTVVLAYALQKLGRGKVFALEHDPVYARRTRTELAQHDLTAHAEVIDAPLEPISLGGLTYRWYAQRALDGIGPIDLVVDDGPPRHVGDMLRYASLPVLGPRLSPGGTFVLDVVGPEERVVLARWRSEHPEFAQEHLPTKKGNVILRRR